jgi:hypothetical protein
VGDDRVHAILGSAELDDGALRRGQVDGLRAIVPRIVASQHDTFLDDGMKDRADDVEGAVDARPSVEDEDAHLLAGADLERVVFVLVGNAVEDDVVGRRRRGRGLGEAGGTERRIAFGPNTEGEKCF